MKIGFLQLAVLFLAGAGILHAANRGRLQDRPAAEEQAKIARESSVPLLTEPLHLADFPGMQPRAELRGKLSQVTGFTQTDPKNGEAASEQTEVWMGRTSSTIYFVFICHDSHPELIRSHLARRENTENDDTVSVLLDPFQDHRKGVLFIVNPAGVQADASWSENRGSDFSYDQVWDSEGKIVSGGWMGLMAIPFRSLRFPTDRSDWGVVFGRSFPRNSEGDNWPAIAASISGRLSQEATLHGIQGVTGSHNFQLNPYTLGQSERMLNDLDSLDPYFSRRKAEGMVGGEAKLILKDSIVVDGTINPDFSDVESDQPQFTVNQRYAVYFPEMRPFFLENANYFSTPITLVYTRNVGHPEYGLRATGKIGGTNIGLFAIDDRAPGETVAQGDPLYLKRAKYFVARASQDLGTGSSAGLIYTDREFGGGWSRVGGADFSWRINNHWNWSGQAVESSNFTAADAASQTDASYAAGPAFNSSFSRQGHAFNLYSTTKSYSTGFGTQVGFIQTTDIYSNHTHSSYQWYPKRGRLQGWGLEADNSIAFDHAGNRVYHYSSFDPYFLLPRSTVIAPLVGQNSDTLGQQDSYNFPANHNFTENWAGLVLRSAPTSQFSFNMVGVHGGNVNYNPKANALPFLMSQYFLNSDVTVQPINQLAIANTYLLDREHDIKNGADVYESQTLRTKLNYQFTRAFSARVIAQYQSTLVNPAETSIERTKQVSTQALLTWLPHPGTAVYVGYNNDLQNMARSLCNRLPSGACDPNNTNEPISPDWLNDGRQFFVKASYLFRF